jgi:aryl-alcohol dehydrogenase-like predicted oxidoreductase
MMPTLLHFGVGSIPWSPLGGGSKYQAVDNAIVPLILDLARPLRTSGETERSKRFGADGLTGASKAIIAKVEEIASKRGITMSQVALAWSISKPFISAPIVGTTKLEQLDELIKGCEIELTAEEIKEIDDLYEPAKIVGHS